ncbi:dihydrodipicolinate synthase family protein [Prosthecobacter dejongeii]|uniref:4-hydroxy-tetrahydrodipicolinate synthase n=1 Tax=Prosthecobacter dejongeii TaxID=48465 RepID=A0A7W7YQH7_9BACT|nr:dihydrodipicolinate synthase family protein [Prosthecobacter dejongeii]MBB5040260.1 4-hydroxy-tetrahydrodipicolinate synthase [Prosthecobacter dejongeii]
MSLPQPLRGIIPPLVTPLSGRDTLDIAGLERLVEHLITGGVHGLFILGTTGEAPSLSYRLRRELIERTCQLVKGRVPVLVGITDTAFVESVNLARYSAEKGVSAVVTAPPYYFPAAPPELQQYIEDLVAEMPLPMFLYNMPGLTKVSFDIELVRRALDMPGICGVKDSSCDMIYFHRLIEVARQRPEWSILVGPEELTAEAVLLGGHGGINGGANLHPSLYVKMYEAAAAQDLPLTRQLHAEVMRLAGSIYTVGRHKSAIIKGIKCGLSLLGICDDQMAEPFQRFREPEREMIRERLSALGLIH